MGPPLLNISMFNKVMVYDIQLCLCLAIRCRACRMADGTAIKCKLGYIIDAQDDDIVRNFHDGPVETTNRHNLISLFQCAEHRIAGLLFLLLWTDKQEIEDSEHQYQR